MTISNIHWDALDRDTRNEHLARQAQSIRRWICGLDDGVSRTKNIPLVGLDGPVVSLPISRYVLGHSDPDPGPTERDLTGCWSAATSGLPSAGYMGPRTAWDCREPQSRVIPRAVVWVMGDPLHVAAIDAIEDALVVRPGEDINQNIKQVRRLNSRALDYPTQHVLVRTHSRRPSRAALDREVEFGRAFVCALEREGRMSVPSAWFPTEATVRPDQLAALAESVADLADDLTLGPDAWYQRGLDHDYLFQTKAGW